MNPYHSYHHCHGHGYGTNKTPRNPVVERNAGIVLAVIAGSMAALGFLVLAPLFFYVVMYVLMILLDTIIDIIRPLAQYFNWTKIMIGIIIVIAIDLIRTSVRQARQARTCRHHGHTYAYYHGVPADDQRGESSPDLTGDYLSDGVDEGYLFTNIPEPHGDLEPNNPWWFVGSIILVLVVTAIIIIVIIN
jgi:hypothetical protein